MFRRRVVEDDFSSTDFSSIDFDEKTKATRPGRKKSDTLFTSFSSSAFVSIDSSDDEEHSLLSPAATAISGETDRAVGQRRAGRKNDDSRETKQKHISVSAFGMLFNSVLVSADNGADNEYQEPRAVGSNGLGSEQCSPRKCDSRLGGDLRDDGSGAVRGHSRSTKNRSPRRHAPQSNGRHEIDHSNDKRKRGAERWKTKRPQSWSEGKGSETFTGRGADPERLHSSSHTPTSPRHRSKDPTEKRRVRRTVDRETGFVEDRSDTRRDRSRSPRKTPKSPRKTRSDRPTSRKEPTQMSAFDQADKAHLSSPRKEARPSSPRKASKTSRSQEKVISPRKQSKASKSHGEISSPRKQSKGVHRSDRSSSPKKQLSLRRREETANVDSELYRSPRKPRRAASEYQNVTRSHSKSKTGVRRTSSSPIPASGPSHRLKGPLPESLILQSFDDPFMGEKQNQVARLSSRDVTERERQHGSTQFPANRKLRRPSMAPAGEQIPPELSARSPHSNRSQSMRSADLGVSSHSSRSRSRSKRQAGHDELVKASSHSTKSYYSKNSSSRRSASRTGDQDLSRHSNRSKSSLRRPSLAGKDASQSSRSRKEQSNGKPATASESGSSRGSSRSPLRRDTSTSGIPDSLLTKASPSQQSSQTGVPSLSSSLYLSSGGSQRADITQESPVSSIHTAQSSRSFLSAFSSIRREALAKLGVPTSSHAYQSENDDSSFGSTGECHDDDNPSCPVFQFDVDPNQFTS